MERGWNNIVISVGAVIGGPECAFMDNYVRSLMRFTKEKRLENSSSNAEVNIVFHLPGSLMKPDYIGLRTGKFSKKENTLMIQAAVEAEFIASNDDAEVISYIFEVADEAIGMAKSFFDRNDVEYDIEMDRQLLDKWKALIEE